MGDAFFVYDCHKRIPNGYLSSMNALVSSQPWKSSSPPRKILIIRFQALGDTIIALPYLLNLKKQYPETELHFFTRKEVSLIPCSIKLFEKVIILGGGRNAKFQFILSLLKIPFLWMQRYDAVMDLQNHKISRIIRTLLIPRSWVEFDRSSPISAGERTRQTIEALWRWRITLETKFILRKSLSVDKLLIKHGWRPDYDLVVLNPAGFCPSRNWPLEHYIDFAKRWLEQLNSQTQFLLLLLPALQEKANTIAEALKENCINLTGKASQVEAFAILQKCRLVLSEDSGLMHLAWVQGIPTLALFSSSRKDWSAPQGQWSTCLDSSDLECGPCLAEVCKFGDNRCLTRYSPEYVLKKALQLIDLTK